MCTSFYFAYAFYATLLRRHSSKRGEGVIANNLQKYIANRSEQKAELRFHATLLFLQLCHKAKYTSWPPAQSIQAI
jgi:hypothetical protein